MSMHSYYKLSLPTILMYYNICGIDLRTVNPNNIETEVSDLNELLPDGAYQYLPASSIRINNEMQTFLDRMCTYFDYSPESLLMKNLYHSAVIGILNIATSLNLIEEECDNYLLHFERLNTILNIILSEINNTPVETVIEFFNLLSSGNARGLVDLSGSVLGTSLLTVLAMNPNPNIADYEMFANPNSAEIDWEKLFKLVQNNACSKYEVRPNTIAFNRISFIESYNSTPRR